MELEINKIFDGKYKIIDVLGEGGMGKVYRVQNTNLGNYWAVKQVSKQTNGSIDLLAEPNIMKKLNHPSLPRILSKNAHN
jgi:serine/threonine-protein kinase